MKSSKCFFTSIISLLICLFYYDIVKYGNNGSHIGVSASEIIASIIFIVSLLSFLVFFILGWAVKDKPTVPKNSTTETNDKNKSE